MRDQLYLALDLLRSLPGPILTSVSEQLMAGVSKLLEQGSGLIKYVMVMFATSKSFT